MRICIFGAGAVGSHFAVRLAPAGHDVACVMRGPHLEAVRARGLTLRVGDVAYAEPQNVKCVAEEDTFVIEKVTALLRFYAIVGSYTENRWRTWGVLRSERRLGKSIADRTNVGCN